MHFPKVVQNLFHKLQQTFDFRICLSVVFTSIYISRLASLQKELHAREEKGASLAEKADEGHKLWKLMLRESDQRACIFDVSSISHR